MPVLHRERAQAGRPLNEEEVMCGKNMGSDMQPAISHPASKTVLPSTVTVKDA